MLGRPKETLETRINRAIAKCSKIDGCWIYPCSRTTRYPALPSIGSLHRVMFEHFKESAEGFYVCHTCDNTHCINPDHLFLGTPMDNMRDRDAKGRNGTLGENATFAKLTPEQVLEIERRGKVENRRKLAVEFGVSIAQVVRIVRHEAWKHLFRNPATLHSSFTCNA